MSQPVAIREAVDADLDVVTEMRLALLADLRGVEPGTSRPEVQRTDVLRMRITRGL